MKYTTLLIDLDETLYASESGVWEAISQRMEQYIHDRLHLPWETIPALRKAMFQQYGTTLRGLQMTYHIDEHDFIDYVHDVPLDQLLQPNPALRQILQQYHQRKIIFTNADSKHAGRVIKRLGLEGCFDGIIDIYDIAPYCKPMPEAFSIALHLVGEEASACAFIDDSPRNLAGAHAAGLFTIQVGHPKPGLHHPEAGADAQIARLIDLPSAIPPVEL